MKFLPKILAVLLTIFASSAMADDVGMHFADGTAVNGKVEQVELDLEFTGTSNNSQDVYNKTKKTLENSFAGFVDATLIDHETGKETEIVLVSDDLKGSAIVALAEDKVLFIWRPVSN